MKTRLLKNSLLSLLLLTLMSVSNSALAASPPVTEAKYINMVVKPYKVDCVGVMPMKCMVVNSQLFYDQIAGFNHVEGFQYQLRVERIKNNNAPADVSRYSYRLAKVLAKYPAPPPIEPPAKVQYVGMTVAPHKVDCEGVGPMKCMVINGRLFYEQIAGFNHIEGYKYQLRVERTQNTPVPADGNRFRYRLVRVLSKQWMK